jgi:DHA2 family multidrug resistance protein-like MFS transporter
LETAVRAGRKEWIGLAVLALPTLLVSVDVFVMLLALPHLSEALHASPTEQLWIMDVYGFLLAGFMITMGTVADRIGKRRLLLVGAAAFGAASLIAAFAPTAPLLIAARALLGVAGATLAPSTLGLISTLFVDARQRGIAIGIWLACFMGGATMGPLVGGVLLEHFWWGSVFLLGVPVMLLLLVLAPMFLPESRTPSDRRLDLASVGLSLAAILSTVWGVKHLAVDGPAVLPLAAVAAGALLGTVFVRRQRQLPEPLVDLALFRTRVFGTALGAMFAGTMLTGAVMFLVAQHMQLVVGLSPLAAGIALVPAAVCSGISFLVSPLLARRTGAGYLIAGGLGVTTVGLLLLSRVPVDAGPAEVAVAFCVTTLGCGPLVTLATDITVGSVPPERAGSAAALNETSGEFGFALGIAVLGSLGAAVYQSRVADAVPAGPARESLAGALTADLPPGVLDAARAAFTTGLHVATLVSAVLVAGLAVLIARNIGRNPS